jgi:acetoin:2,6-dichlorophenolindophenol oxidoreductase subunit beta
MRKLRFGEAIEDALMQAMAADEKIIIMGEDVHGLRLNLRVRFGRDRVLPTPISEAAFVGAAVSMAMAGLHPIAEVMLVDFLGVTMDAVLNQAAKIERFSNGKWKVPLVIRAACGGGYGDGGQHEQSLWGWLAHIPGLVVLVPSTPFDAGGMMMAALAHGGPVIYLEHKLLSEAWLDSMGGGSRKNIHFDVPADGARGEVPKVWDPIPIGEGVIRRIGTDLTIIGVGVSVHRAIEAANRLEKNGISSEVIDLRTVAPLDKKLVIGSTAKTGKMLVLDEDYQWFGLSGELAATVLEAGVNIKFSRVCTTDTIPFSRDLEYQTLPNVERIMDAAVKLVKS